MLKTENTKIKKLYATLKRNYDSVTLHAMKDVKRSQKALSMEQGYLKKIDELKTAKLDAEHDMREIKAHLLREE